MSNVRKSDAAEAELSILGGVLLDNGAIDRIATLEPAHFAAERHRVIFAAMQRLAAAGEPIDAITLGEVLDKAGTLNRVGGAEYIWRLSDAAASAINIAHHAKLVREYATVRDFVAELGRLHLAASTGNFDAIADLIGEAADSMMALGQGRSDSSVVPVRVALRAAIEQVQQAYENPGALTGLSTGFEAIDALTNGLRGGELIILAARPAIGKSALAQDIAVNVARSGVTVAKFDLEMGTTESAARVLASQGRVDGRSMQRGSLTEGDIERLIQTVKNCSDLPLMLDETSAASLAHIRGVCRQIAADKSTPPLGLVVIDYLQLMSGDKRAGNREQEISGIARGLKGLAKSLNVPVVALSQCSRKCEERQNKRPLLSDLRESGAIEQDANIVAFVYRDDYYNEDSEDAGIAEVIVAKNRSGATGTAKLRFRKEWTKFMDIEPGGY